MKRVAIRNAAILQTKKLILREGYCVQLKNIYCLILSIILVVVFGICPQSALAQTEDDVFDFTIGMGNRSGNGWAWVADKKTLTFNEFSYQSEGKCDRFIILPADSCIHLESETVNKITVNANSVIFAEGDLVITGKGKLEIINNSPDVGSPIAAIQSNGNTFIEDIGLYVSGGNGGIVAGSEKSASNIEIENGTILLENLSQIGAALMATGGINISNSNLEIKNAEAGIMAYGDGGVQMKESQIQIEAARYGVFGNGVMAEGSTATIVIIDETGIAIENSNRYTTLDNWKPITIEVSNVLIESLGKGIVSSFGSLLKVDNSDVIVRTHDIAIDLQGDGHKNISELEIVNGRILAEGKMGIVICRFNEQSYESPVFKNDVVVNGGLKMHMAASNDGYLATLIDYETVKAERIYFLLPRQVDFDMSESSQMSKHQLMGIIAEKIGSEGRQRVEIYSPGYQFKRDSGDICFYVGIEGDTEAQQLILPLLPEDKGYIDTSGRTMIPLRALVERMDYDVSWDGEKKTITITDKYRKSKEVMFAIDSYDYVAGYTTKTMDTTAVLTPAGKTYVPLRYVIEGMEMAIETKIEDDGTRRVVIVD